MSTLDQHQSNEAVKALICGESKSGKTALLGTLANAGHRLFILDFDNGLDVLKSYTKPEFYKNVFFKTLTEKIISAEGKTQGTPMILVKTLEALDKWIEPGPPGPDGKPTIVNMGGPATWGEKDVLCIDSLTLFGNACMRHALALNGRLGQRPTQGDWGDAIRYQENLLEALFSSSVKCNVVVNAHVLGSENEVGVTRYFPSALGNKLPGRVARYFNSMLLLQVTTTTTGGTARQLRTQPTSTMTLGTPLSDIPPTIPADLATFFSAVRRGKWAGA